jgi:hypothetical protein
MHATKIANDYGNTLFPEKMRKTLTRRITDEILAAIDHIEFVSP